MKQRAVQTRTARNAASSKAANKTPVSKHFSLDSEWAHFSWLSVAQINRRLSIVLLYIVSLRPSFVLRTRSFILSLWSHQNETHMSCTIDSIWYSSTSVPTRTLNEVSVSRKYSGSERTPVADQRSLALSRNCYPGHRATWTSETITILKRSCSQVIRIGCHIQWIVNWSIVWEVTASQGSWASIGWWEKLQLSAIVTIIIQRKETLVHGGQV